MNYNTSYYNDAVVERVIDHAYFLVNNRCTIRKVAEHSEFSKTTIHKDFTEILPIIDYELYKKVKAILEVNKAERAHRGGVATSKKHRNRID